MPLRNRLLIAFLVCLSTLAAMGLALWKFRRQAEDPGSHGGRGAPAPSFVAKVPGIERDVRAEEKLRRPMDLAAESPTGRRVSSGPEDGWRITGRVVRVEATGEVWPVEGARVFLGPHPLRTNLEGEPQAQPQTGISGTEGQFEFVGCPGRRWLHLEIDEPESALETFSFQLGDPDSSGLRDLGDIPLEPPLSLQVELVGPKGEAVEKGRILGERDDSAKGLALERESLRDSRREARELGAGKYVVERMGAGAHSLKVLAPGYAGTRETVQMPCEEPVMIRLAPGRRLAGNVLARDGTPFVGAIAEVSSGPNLLEPDSTLPTDKTGFFLFDFLSEGDYDVSIMAEGHTSQRLRGVPSGTETLEFTLEPEAILSGRVVAAESSSPVARATVTLQAVTGSMYSAESGPDGTFSIRKLPSGPYLLEVTHRDFARYTEKLPEVKAGELIEGRVLRLPTGIFVAGLVVDRNSQKPIADAQVFLYHAGPTGRVHEPDSHLAGAGSRRTSKTNDSGRFEVKGLGDGRYKLSSKAAGYLPDEAREIEISPSGTADLKLELRLGGAIAGKVIDSKGNPVGGATVRPVVHLPVAEDSLGSLGTVFELTTTTEPDGSYKLAGLPAHKAYTVSAQHGSYPEGVVKGIAVEPGEMVAKVDIVLPSGSSIRGRVIDSGDTGVAGATVQASREHGDADDEDRFVMGWSGARSRITSTAQDGFYSIDALPAASYTVSALAKDRRSATKRNVKLDEGRPTEGVDLVLGAVESLRGIVSDTAGGRLPGARVQVFTGDAVPTRTQTDADGRFEVQGLAKGEASVRVSQDGFASVQTMVQIPPSHDVAFQLERTARILGVLRAEGVTVFSDCEVFSSSGVLAAASREILSSGSNKLHWSRCDPSGSFEIDVEAGTHVLHARARGLVSAESQPITVKAGEHIAGFVIDLARGGTIEGVVVDAVTGAPLEGAKVLVLGSRATERTVSRHLERAPGTDRTDTEGKFLVSGLEYGVYSLRVSRNSYAGARLEHIRCDDRGKTQEIRVALEPAITFRARVVDARGRPLSGAWVLIRGEEEDLSLLERQSLTDASGLVSLTGARSQVHELVVVHPSYAISRRRVEFIDGGEVTLELLPGARVQVIVVNRQGRPVEGATVDIFDGSGTNLADDLAFASVTSTGSVATTTADGTLVLERVLPGKYRVIARTDRAHSSEELLTIEEGKAAEARLVISE